MGYCFRFGGNVACGNYGKGGYYKRYCGEGQTHGRLVEIVMENIISDAQIPGIKDAIFVFRPDKNHEGFYLPYLFTVAVLVFTSIRNKRENQPPASLGLSYFREER